MMCSECNSVVSSAVVLAWFFFLVLVVSLVVYLIQKYEIKRKSARLKYLESSLHHQVVVQDPNELECLIEYIELLVKLGFKSKEINRMVLSCCFTQDLDEKE